MPVQALTSIDPHQFFNLRQRSDAEVYRLDTKVNALSISNDFSGRLSVKTAEGDTITLTADLETDFRSISYASRAETDRTVKNLEANQTQYRIQHDFGIAVDGNLNEEETRDLNKLFQNISDIFRGFFHGQDEAARAHTATLAKGFSGLGTLSALDLRVEVVRSVAVMAASGLTSGGATEAVASQSPNGTSAPTPSPDLPDATQSNMLRKDTQLASLIQQVLDALKEATVELEKIRTRLPDFLEQLRADLAKQFRDENKPTTTEKDRSVAQVSDELSDQIVSTNLYIAYRTISETSIALSIKG